MMSHDVIAFYLLSEGVSKEVKVVLAGQGADEVFGGYFWCPLMDAETGPAVERFSRHYVDRDHAECLEMIAPAWHGPDVTTELVARELGKPQADTFLDEVWRFDAPTLIVDDPVKRVDNTPMAWGLQVRVPFLDHELVELAARMPPGLKLKEGGKYPLKAISRGVIPDALIDRPKGYFPVPALKHVRGPVPRTDARHPAIRYLHPAQAIAERTRRQAVGQPRGVLHAQSGQQAVALGAAGMVASSACEQRREWCRRGERMNPPARLLVAGDSGAAALSAPRTTKVSAAWPRVRA